MIALAPYEQAGSARLLAKLTDERFYIGTPCKTCGGTHRYTHSGACSHCARKKAAEHTRRVRAARKVGR
jgi:uncharacterized OB-fold protein